MTINEIIRPDPPDAAWEAELERLKQTADEAVDAVLAIQQMALHWNPFRAARWLTAVAAEGYEAAMEGEQEGRLWVLLQVQAMWPLRKTRRLRRVWRVVQFQSWRYRVINKLRVRG